jgi:transmembrane sensor
MPRSNDSNKVVPFSGGSSEEAGLWLARLDRGLSSEERARLEHWLLQTPANATALRELAAFWHLPELLADLPLTAAPAAKRVSYSRWMAAAATVLVAVGVAWYFHFSNPAQPPLVVQFEQTYRTAVGEHVSESLPDGSSVTLNTDNEVHVRYLDNERLVQMVRGEAHFTVAHDVDRPFGVRAGEHIVQAVGTAFNVRLEAPGEVEVMVTDGVVRILDEKQTVADEPATKAEQQWWLHPVVGSNLIKGQVAKLEETGPQPILAVTELDPDSIDSRLAWQRGELEFEGEPLQAVLDEFARYTTTRFVLASEDIAGVRVGGFFKVGDIGSLLANLDENFRIRAERMDGDRILLLPAE